MTKTFDTTKLRGKTLLLWQLLRRPRGVNEVEGCAAVEWQDVGTTLRRLREAARAAGMLVEDWQGRDGRRRWRVRRAPRTAPQT